MKHPDRASREGRKDGSEFLIQRLHGVKDISKTVEVFESIKMMLLSKSESSQQIPASLQKRSQQCALSANAISCNKQVSKRPFRYYFENDTCVKVSTRTKTGLCRDKIDNDGPAPIYIPVASNTTVPISVSSTLLEERATIKSGLTDFSDARISNTFAVAASVFRNSIRNSRPPLVSGEEKDVDEKASTSYHSPPLTSEVNNTTHEGTFEMSRKSPDQKYAVSLVDIEWLKAHERVVSEERVVNLQDATIAWDAYKLPLLVDSRSGAILDGHHRHAVGRALGLSRLPAVLVDYLNDDSITLDVWPGCGIDSLTKEEVIEMSLSERVYPPKTSRHRFVSKLSSIHVPLSKLVPR